MPDTLTPAPANATSPRPIASAAWRRVAVLVIGDVLVFLLFAGGGRGTHGEATGLGALGSVALTALPFIVGWFLASPFLGVFRRRLTDTPTRMLTRTELGWLATWPVALALRWAFTADHHVPPLSFALVALLANALFLGVWRGVFALVERQREHA